MGYRIYPLSQEGLWKCSEEDHLLSKPITVMIPLLAPSPLPKEGVQMEIRPGYNPALQCLQNFNQARAQLESKLSEDTQMLEHKYNAHWNKIEEAWTGMDKNGPGRRLYLPNVFSMTSSAEYVKLLPWCFSTSTPFTIQMIHWWPLSNREKPLQPL